MELKEGLEFMGIHESSFPTCFNEQIFIQSSVLPMKFDFPWDPALVLHKTYGLTGFFVTLVKGWAPFWWVYLNGIGSFGGTGIICLYFVMVVQFVGPEISKSRIWGPTNTSKTHPDLERQGTLRMAMVLGVPQLGTGEPASARLKFRMELLDPKRWS